MTYVDAIPELERLLHHCPDRVIYARITNYAVVRPIEHNFTISELISSDTNDFLTISYKTERLYWSDLCQFKDPARDWADMKMIIREALDVFSKNSWLRLFYARMLMIDQDYDGALCEIIRAYSLLSQMSKK